MKKLLFIFVVLLWGCTKPDIPYPQILAIDDIFSVTQSNVVNGQSIHFDLPSADVYYLTLIDKESGNVISREKFIGQKGENVKKVYTKSISVKYLYLLLEDVTKKEINKTTLIIN